MTGWRERLAAWWGPNRAMGVNLVGYARGGLGLGETLRQFADALQAEGLPHAVVDVNLHLGDRGRDLRLEPRIGTHNPHPVNLMFIAGAEMPAVRAHLGERFFAGKHTVGYWFWELDTYPAEWRSTFESVDEVWTATAFVQGALQRAAPDGRVVQRVPHPVAWVAEGECSAPGWRAAQGWGPELTVMLFSFDFHSYLARKHPEAVLEAFRLAFPRGDEPVRLVLKSMNGAQAPAALAALQGLAGSDPRVEWRDGFWPHAESRRLMAACDVYVSLHRSEGFGQGLAEAMAMGKAVVATGYSGNLDFMDEEVAALVPYRLVPVQAGEYPCSAGLHWAQADVQAAAQWLRRLVDEPTTRLSLGAAARKRIRHTHAPGATAQAVAAQLQRLRDLRGGSGSGPRR